MTTGLTSGEVRQIQQGPQELLKEFDSLEHAARICRAFENDTNLPIQVI